MQPIRSNTSPCIIFTIDNTLHGYETGSGPVLSLRLITYLVFMVCAATQLDTDSLQWRELEPTDATRPVMRRTNGGMISLEQDGVYHFLMIGGYGSEPAIQL